MNNTRYIVVGCARSGTTVTHLALKGHPFIAALNDEVKVQSFFLKGLSSFTFGYNDTKEEKEGHIALFDSMTSICATNKSRAFGIKVAIGSPKMATIFTERMQKSLTDVKIIWTKRDDLLAQCGSLVRARKSGKFHSWRESNKNIKSVTINKTFFIAYVLNCLDIFSEFDRLDQSHNMLKFSYEKDILTNNFTPLFEFLNVPIVDIDWLDSKKVAPNPSDYINNYKELFEIMEQIKRAKNENSGLEKFERIRKNYNTFKHLRHKCKAIVDIILE